MSDLDAPEKAAALYAWLEANRSIVSKTRRGQLQAVEKLVDLCNLVPPLLSEREADKARIAELEGAAHDVPQNSHSDGYGQSAVDSEWLGKLEDASGWNPTGRDHEERIADGPEGNVPNTNSSPGEPK